MKDLILKTIAELEANTNIRIVDGTRKYEVLDDFIFEMEVERLKEDNFKCNESHKELISLSDFLLSWEGDITNVDMVLTGGFNFNSIADALLMTSTFWKGAFSIGEGDPVPLHLADFSNLGWFAKQPWDDGRRSCFFKDSNVFPPRVAFYSRGWYATLDSSLEEYLKQMFLMCGAKGWQFFFIELTSDMTYKEDILNDMRVIVEQFPLLFPEGNWEFLTKKYHEALTILV